MSTKYHGLPDIDTAPDVFETADEPESSLRPQEDLQEEKDVMAKQSMSEAIDSSGLPNRRKAEKVFGRGTKKPSTFTFRPQLPSLHYQSSDSENELSIPKETPAARLRRIKAELAEVEREMAASTFTTAPNPEAHTKEPEKRKSVIPPKPPVDLVSELSSLRTRLNAVQVDKEVGNFKRDEDGDLKKRLESLTILPDPGNGASSDKMEVTISEGNRGCSESGPKLSELDQRLALLEDLIGPSGEGLDQTASSPLLPTVNKLDHLLALLTQPRHLDVISRRVKLLLVDLDRASSSSARRPGAAVTATPLIGSNTDKPQSSSTSSTLSQTEYNSLQTLFSLLPRLDPLLPILPPLLARLRSLATLHAEAGEVAEGLKRLNGDDRRYKDEVRDLEAVVQGVKKGLDEAVNGIQRNWEGLEGRMRSLEERLHAVSK